MNFNQRTRCSFKIFSHVVGVGSNEACGGLEGSVGAVNAIDKTLDFLCWSRDCTPNGRRSLQQVVMNLPVIRNMTLKRINPSVPLDVLQII